MMVKADFNGERELLAWMRVLQFVELSAIHLDLSNRRARLPAELLALKGSGRSELTTWKIFERRSSVVQAADRLVYRLEGLRRTYSFRLNSFGSMLLVEEKPALIRELTGLNEEVEQFKAAYAIAIVKAYEETLEKMLAQVLQLAQVRQVEGEELEAYARRRLQLALGKPERFLASMRVKVVYKNMTVEMLTDGDFRRELQSFPKVIRALAAAGLEVSR